MITLQDIDTKGKPWILQTDNPMFGFVECNKDGNYDDHKDPVYDTNITDQNNGDNVIGYTYHIDDFITEDPALTAKEMSERMSGKTGIVPRTIQRDLAELQAKGIITREGGRKEGKWVIINKKE